MFEKVLEEAKSLLDFSEVGHILLYMIRRYIEDACTCGVQASSIFDHKDTCAFRQNVIRYCEHAVERQREAREALHRKDNPPPPKAPLPPVFSGPRPVPAELSRGSDVPRPRVEPPLPPHDPTSHADILRAIREADPEAFHAAVRDAEKRG